MAPSVLLCGAAAASHKRLGAAVTGGESDSCALSEVEERLRCLALQRSGWMEGGKRDKQSYLVGQLSETRKSMTTNDDR